MDKLSKIKAEIKRQKLDALSHGWTISEKYMEELLSFIESLEKEPKGKTNPLFEECLANVDPAVRQEVNENIDKMLEKEQDTAKDLQWAAMEYVSNIARKSTSARGWQTDDIVNAYKAGYEYGCRHAAVLYDDMEKERQRRQEEDGTLAPDDPATNEEIKKRLADRRLEVLKLVEKEYHTQLTEAWDEAGHEGYLEGWKECEAAWKRAQDELPKIKGWVARDEDGSLFLFLFKPQRGNSEWLCGADCWYQIDGSLFPEVTWQSKPIEVELTIIRKA